MKVSVIVPGEPEGKGRPRFARHGDRVITRTPEKTALYEARIKAEWHKQNKDIMFPEDAMLEIKIDAYFRIPKQTSRVNRAAMMSQAIRPTKRPDIDNIEKAVCDALNGVAYKDDSQIVTAHAYKYYSNDPRVVIEIKEVKG